MWCAPQPSQDGRRKPQTFGSEWNCWKPGFLHDHSVFANLRTRGAGESQRQRGTFEHVGGFHHSVIGQPVVIVGGASMGVVDHD